jgi:hypothetical protein
MQDAAVRAADMIKLKSRQDAFDIRSVLSTAALEIIFQCAYGIDLCKSVRRCRPALDLAPLAVYLSP